jgi:spermidine/putrescine transport system ATP-binding protein/putrescine transport system ATP-binding protein
VIAIEHVVKDFGRVRALDDVSLTVGENEFFALLGPSGCGKTTLLRCIGGFEEVTSGRILLDGRDLVGSRPYDRPVNMMFQSYALFPHMSVWDNVAYGLRAERRPKEEIRERVDEVLRIVGLQELADRRPKQLSGGQSQRVALSRAIVKRPRVLLLDEPLAALDRKMRGEMQLELKRLQHEVGITFVVVTHDQEEAMTMADRIAVMNAGRVLQVATPEELYDRPADHFVAAFIGKMNFLAGTIVDGGVRSGTGAVLRGRVDPEHVGRAGYLAVRPESARILGDGEGPAGGEDTLSGSVESVVFVGSQAHAHVVLDLGGTPFTVTSQRPSAWVHAGDRVLVAWPVERARVLPG